MGKGHMDFPTLFAAVNFREGYRMGRYASWNGTDWYEIKNGFFCRGTYTGKGNGYKLSKCAFPPAAERAKKDWIVMQDENGRIPEL